MSWASCRWKRTRMKLAPDGNASTPAGWRSAKAAGDPAALLDERADALVHLGDVTHRQRAGELLGGVEVIRQDHLVELGDHPRRGHGITQSGCRHAPRLGERAHNDEASVVGDLVECRPGRELGVGLVDDDEASGVRQHRLEDVRRLDHAGRVVRRAQKRHRRIGAIEQRGGVVGSIVKSSRRSPATTVAPVIRAMWRWS